MLQTVRRYINAHHLLSEGCRCIVALSGGADSVCLLLILKNLGYEVEAAHCNFHLRGAESERDEQFCVALCQQQNIPLHRIHFDTKEYADLHKVSIEMAARDLRYGYFRQLLRDLNAEVVCVAHHRDDVVETVLLNLLRGTGIEGLKGISPRNDNVVRPLLSVSRQQILDYLTLQHQTYVTDSSNLVADVQRNKLRLNIIPQLLDVNPAAKENIFKTAELVTEALKVVDDYQQQSTGRVLADGRIDLPLLRQQLSGEMTLWNILSQYGFSSSQVRSIYENLDAAVGTQWTSATHLLLKDRDCLLIESVEAFQQVHFVVPETGNYLISNGMRLTLSVTERTDGFQVSRAADLVTIDADKVQFPLTLRTIAEGDAFQPFGMKGRKLISDYLTDKKVTLFDRRRQLVLVDATGTIIWLVGYRVSQRVAITPSTKRVLTASVVK